MLDLLLMAAAMCVAAAAWVQRRVAARGGGGGGEPPALPGGWPLLGHVPLLFGDSANLWEKVKALSYDSLRAGGVLSVKVLRTVYVVTDPDDYLTVANACLQKDNFYEFAKPWLGEGLVTGDVSIWKVHRKLLNPAFSQVVLDGFLDVFNKQARRLVRNLESEVGKGPFDHWVYTRHNALETICLTALGVDFTHEDMLNAEYVGAAERMFSVLVERFQNPWWHSDYLYSFSELYRKQQEYLRVLHNMSNTVLKQRKADYLKNRGSAEVEDNTKGLKFKPFMDLLLELGVERGALNDREIREHVDTMIVGGHDTSASVLMYCMLLVGAHPEVQDRIVLELDEVFGDDDRDASKGDLSRLQYLEAALKETVRVLPIVPVTARRLQRDVRLRHCTLRRGRTCFLFAYGTHRHAAWGADAELFRPERWLDPSLPAASHAFVGFGLGRRICIGKSYAYMSMKTTLAHVLRRYRVRATCDDLCLELDVMLRPRHGHHLCLERRARQT